MLAECGQKNSVCGCREAAINEFLCHKHRERRLKAGKMLQWSILSESPSNYVAKAT